MNAGRSLFGTLLATIGVLFILDSAGSLDAVETIGRWWPAAVVALGAFHAFGTSGSRRGSLVLIGVGLALLGVTTGTFGEDAWRFVWPSALVLAGLWVLGGWGRRYGIKPSDDEEVDGIAVLGSVRLATRSQSFRRASLTSVLGGITLDLADALPIGPGAEITVTSFVGRVTILVPRGWSVEMRGIPLLGGWDDTTDRSAVGSGSPRLEVQALLVLGGVEVKHSGRWR